MSSKANGQNKGPTHPNPPLRWRHHQLPPCHAAVATFAVMNARVRGSRSATVLFSARLTGRAFSERCTALAFRATLACLVANAEAPTAAVMPIAARALWTALKRAVLRCANDRWLNERLPWKLGRANERPANERLMCGAK